MGILWYIVFRQAAARYYGLTGGSQFVKKEIIA